MAVQPDPELESWQRQWQAHDVVSRDLRQRVEREIRMERVGIACSIAVTVIFGLGIPAWAAVSHRGDLAVLAVAVWVFIAAAWLLARRLGAAPSRPAATTAAYLAYSIHTCRRRHRAIVAASVLYVAIMAFDLAWIYRTRSAPPGVAAFLGSKLVITVGVVSIVLGGLAVWRRKRLERELENLLELRRQLQASGGA